MSHWIDRALMHRRLQCQHLISPVPAERSNYVLSASEISNYDENHKLFLKMIETAFIMFDELPTSVRKIDFIKEFFYLSSYTAEVIVLLDIHNLQYKVNLTEWEPFKILHKRRFAILEFSHNICLKISFIDFAFDYEDSKQDVRLMYAVPLWK